MKNIWLSAASKAASVPAIPPRCKNDCWKRKVFAPAFAAAAPRKRAARSSNTVSWAVPVARKDLPDANSE